MSEKNILAYFNTPEQAKSAAAKLKALKIVDMSIDRVNGAAGVSSGNGNMYAGHWDWDEIKLGGEDQDQDARVMAAVDVDSSGMSDGGGADSFTTSPDILLTVVVEEADHKQALQLIEEAGGTT